MSALREHTKRVEAASEAEAKHDLGAAVALYREAIAAEPWQRSTYTSLVRVLLERGATDAAWCTVAVRALFGDHDAIETDFLADHQPRRLPPRVTPLDDGAWRLLRGATDDGAAEGAAPGLLPVVDDAPPTGVPLPVFSWAASALGLSMPGAVSLPPRASLDDVTGAVRVREALFRSGVELCRRALVGDALVVEGVALRAGLLLVGDIRVARDVLLGRPDPRARLRDLVAALAKQAGMPELMVFATSEAHVALRARLGLSIEAMDDLHA